MSEITHAVEELRDTFRSINERQEKDLSALEERMNEVEKRLGRASLESKRDELVTSGPLLTLEQKASDYWRIEKPDYPAAEVRPGALVLAQLGGQATFKHLRDAERKAIVEMVGPQGGYLIPELVAGLWLDAVRPASRVLSAGARTLPMQGPVVHLVGWDDAPSAAWRGETDAFADAGGSFRRIRLEAKTVAAEREISIEELEDAGEDSFASIADRVEDEMGRAIAQAIDAAALLGAGANNEPLGLYNTAGVSVDHLGAALSDYDPFLDAIYSVESGNFAPTGYITSPRVKRDLAKLVTGISGDKTKLTVPEDVRALARFVTNQVPEDIGDGSDETLIFVGQWDRLVIGLRPNMGVRFQRDPFSKGSNGLVVIRAYARADVAVLDKGAFAVIDQVQ